MSYVIAWQDRMNGHKANVYLRAEGESRTDYVLRCFADMRGLANVQIVRLPAKLHKRAWRERRRISLRGM